MDALWIVLGVALLALTFADTFVTVLNYDEGGILVNRLVRWQWIAIRAFTRRVSRRWRPIVLRQVTGVLLLTTILSWLTGVILGFALIYLGLIGLGAFQLSKGVDSDFVGALYLSVGQFSTVGADNIAPGGGWVNLVPVLEALTSVVMLSFIITFLGNIYGVIQLLRSLCADFFSTGPGVGSPVEALQPYFPNGEPRDIDRHLNELVGDFNLYCDSLRQDHAAYHFQSGDEQFALPFALFMTSGTIAALRWGLPTGHPASVAPSLPRLAEAFDDFRERRYRKMHWATPVLPRVLDADAFAASFAAYRARTIPSPIDPWAARFLALNDEMAELVGAPAPTDVADAYARYTAWLPFAYPAAQFVAAVSRDLDYQPIYRGVSTHADDPAAAAPATTAAAAPSGDAAAGSPPPVRRPSPFTAWLWRRQLLLDPGCVRLTIALRTLGAVVAAVVVAALLGVSVGGDPTTAAVFAGLLALFSAPMTSGWGGGLWRGTGLLPLIPVVVGITAGAFLPRDPVGVVVGVAIVAAVAVWLGRFGAVWATFGQVGFIAYYFSLLLAVSQREFLGALAAAAIGVVCSWAGNVIPLPKRDKQITAAMRAVRERASALIDAAVDALTSGTSARSGRILRAESEALRRSATALEALLDPDAAGTSLPGGAAGLRLRVFDIELTAGNLTRALPGADDGTVTMEQRSRLAGELIALQERLRRGDGMPDPSTGQRSVAPAGWPIDARRALAAIAEFGLALDRFHPHAETDAEVPVEPVKPVTRSSAPNRATVTAVDKRAVQAGVSTGVALFLGSFVSSTHEYWAAMPAYQALSQSDGETAVRSIQRIIGTVIGAACAFGLALWTGHDSVIAFAVLAVSVFFMSLLRAVASSWTAFWQTVLLATMYDLLGQLTAEAVGVRVVETVIGAVVATVVSLVILPTRTRVRVLDGMAACVSTVAGVVHAALQRLSDSAPAPSSTQQTHDVSEQELTMRRQLDAVAQHADPLRRGPGALQRTGIEAQLAALSALAYYARRLLTDADERTAASADPGVWQTMDAVTRDNFAATIAVLDDRLPSRIHTIDELPGLASGETPDDTTAIRDIRRINLTLLGYMETVRPGSSDSS